MIDKFKKLMILIDNYDKIIEMLENNDNKPKKTKKAYSLFNTPMEQQEYINKKMKGEK